MSKTIRILFVGESFISHITEYKGYDHFSETGYHVPAEIMRRILEGHGFSFTHMPCHLVARDYPRDMETLGQYNVVLFSDVGSNTFLLLPEMTQAGKRTVNLLALTKEYVQHGGGFGMIGGYMTFQGFQAKGKWKDSHIEDILPVTMLPYDDRVELPEGIDLVCNPDTHPILEGLPAKWPYVFGYNQLIAKEQAQVLVRVESDPIIAVSHYGNGRSLAYATDCTPHWAPPAMCEWEYYGLLWKNIIHWLSGETEK